MILRKLPWITGASLVLAAVFSMVILPVASAATTPTNNGANGLRVSPVRADATINPGQSQSINISVTNITASATTLQAVVNDFTARKDESGQPAIIFDANKFADSHSLKRFVQPIPNFSLEPGQQKSITVTVNVPANAAGGGYYAAVRFAPAGSLETGPNQNLTLAGSVGTLLLVKVPGDIKEQLSITGFDVRKYDQTSTFFTSHKNIDVVVRFQNGGNIQEQPFGKILLKNRSGKILATYEINNVEPRGNVLPDSIRKFAVPLDKVGSFGEFKLEGSFGYGSNGQLLSASTTFYVVPLIAIYIFIAIVLLIAFMIFGFPRLLAAYKRRIISQARRR